ncbi:hypothetical protein N9K07_00345 [Arenitalea sp.]|nr:hypothetical protein [Algibacter sp.]MDA9069188.1 hypothetical protein [Algibacter sp.]
MESILDFGKYKGKTIRSVLEDKTSANYINWCFQKLDIFCVSDQVFNEMPFVIQLREITHHQKETKDWLKKIELIHAVKKEKLNEFLYGVLPYGRKYKFSKEEIVRRDEFNNSLLKNEYSIQCESDENEKEFVFESVFKDDKSGVPFKRIGWYPSGELFSEQTYKNGEIDGLSLNWYANGQISKLCRYKEGVKDGLEVTWYVNGQIETEKIKKAGYSESFRMWLENGQWLGRNPATKELEEDYNYTHNDTSYLDDTFDDTFDGDEQMQEWYWSNENN